MKKSILFLAMLFCTSAASATVINAVPAGDIAYYLSIAQPGDIIELADGVYDEKSILTFSVEGLVVKAAEGASPVIQTVGKWMKMNVEATTTFEGIVFDAEAGTDGDNQYGFDISANTTFNDCKFQDYTQYDVKILAETTTFDNCIFNGAGVTPSAIIIAGTIAECSIENCEFKNYKDYNISVEDNTTITTLTIDQCVLDGANTESVKTTKAALFTKGIVSTSNIQDSEFKNFAECAITVDKWYGGRYDALAMNNCRIHDCVNSAIYLPYAIDTNEKQTCSDFKLTNSTIYNIGNGGSFGTIDIQDNATITSSQQVEIDHVTIYNFLNSGWHGAIKVEESANAVVSNCIVMNTVQEWANPYKLFTGAQIKNSLYYNTEYADNGATTTNLVEADPMFVDAANGDFMLYAESPAVGAGTDGSNLGDPRWGVKAGLKPGAGVLSNAVENAKDGATITLGDGIYEESSSFDFNKEGLTIVAAEGTKPVIKTTGEWTSLKLSASTTFDGITFDGNNITKYPITSTGTSASNYIFKNCEFKNYITYAISNPYNGGTYAKSVVIDNCLFHNGGAAVCFNKRGYNGNAACDSFKMTNTTIYNVTCSEWVGIIHIASNEETADAQNEVIIDHVTMYNFTPNELGGITSRFSENVSITNSIFANPADNANQYAFRVYGTSEVKNTLYYNTKIEGTPTDPINADPLFVNAAENNFQLYANSPAIGAGTDNSNLGDPRWGVSAKVLGKRINVTPDQASSLPYMISSNESNVKAGDTLVLADGTYSVSSIDFNKEGLVVMAAENAKPTLKLTDTFASMHMKTTTTFEGIAFDGTDVTNYLILTSGTNIGKLAFNNCEFTNYLYYAISDPWTDKYENGTHADTIVINNCLFHDANGSAVYLSKYGPDGKHTCNYFEIKNTSIYNIGSTGDATILISSNAEATGAQNKVIIDHITLYNYATSEYGGIAIRKTNDLQITNSIIANPTAGLTAIYHYSEVQNDLFHNVTLKTSDGAAYNATCVIADPLFVDAANSNFKLKGTSPAVYAATDGTHLGDPRWGVEMLEIGDVNDAAAIGRYDGKTIDVQVNRTFTANDGWYTLSLPFDLPQVQLSKIGKAYKISEDASKYTYNNGAINVPVEPVNELSACLPYLILPTADIDGFVAEDVKIAYGNGAEADVTIHGISDGNGKNYDFSMTSELYVGGTETTDGSYWVGADGLLYNDDVQKLALRAYFNIAQAGGNGIPPRFRVVAGENVETGVGNITSEENTAIKTIENGQLIIIREGVKYNVQGVRL